MSERYDVIIAGSGAGVGTLARILAPSGKRILLLERGNFLPRDGQLEPGPGIRRWEVHLGGHLVRRRRQAIPAAGALLRRRGHEALRRRAVQPSPGDFGEIQHVTGSPAWPLSYQDFEPWCTKAEWLYQVHGAHGEDLPRVTARSSTHGRRSPTSHASRGSPTRWRRAATTPFHAPVSILLNEANRALSACIRCATCDRYPCLVHAKAGVNTAASLAPSITHRLCRFWYPQVACPIGALLGDQRCDRPGSPGASFRHVPCSGSYSFRSKRYMSSPRRMSE